MIKGLCVWSVVHEIVQMKTGNVKEFVMNKTDCSNGFIVMSWNATGWLSNSFEFGFFVRNVDKPPIFMCILE